MHSVDVVTRAKAQSATDSDAVLPAHRRSCREQRKLPVAVVRMAPATSKRRSDHTGVLCKASRRCNADNASGAIVDAPDRDFRPHAGTTRCGSRALRTVGNTGRPRDTDHAARHQATMCSTRSRAGVARGTTASDRRRPAPAPRLFMRIHFGTDQMEQGVPGERVGAGERPENRDKGFARHQQSGAEGTASRERDSPLVKWKNRKAWRLYRRGITPWQACVRWHGGTERSRSGALRRSTTQPRDNNPARPLARFP